MTCAQASFARIGDGRGWTFLNGVWTDEPGGELAPPDGTRVEYLAVRERETFADFAARFRFRLRHIATVRFLFRLQDSRRFYALDLPFGGQQFRGRACWAGLVVADGTPLQRYLSFGLVPGQCAALGRWYDVRVEAVGARLRAWLNDVPVADVKDSTYRAGRLGLGSVQTPYIEAPRFAGLQVTGPVCAAPDWPGLAAPAPHWLTPCAETEPGTYQSYANLIRSNSGAVTLFLTYGNPNAGQTQRAVYCRSTDGGRTWAPPEPATLDIGFGGPFVRRDGTWVCLHARPEQAEAPLVAYCSPDEGRTWRGPEPLRIAGGWPPAWRPGTTWRVVRRRDGTLVAPVMAALAGEPATDSQCPFWAALCLRSTDDGHTWSAPVLCDADARAAPAPPAMLRYAARYYEVAMDEAADGALVGIGRPDRDPYMWQLRSPDGGSTWEPAAVGHFPGYCPSLTRTASGALVATTRYPHFAAHLSRDHGRTWEPPVIVDYAIWANQQAVEVEPDVVLVSYMGHIMEPGQADSRIARLRVTERGLALDH